MAFLHVHAHTLTQSLSLSRARALSLLLACSLAFIRKTWSFSAAGKHLARFFLCEHGMHYAYCMLINM